MPVYLTQWRDGDCSIAAATSREEAYTLFQKVACLDDEDIVELEAPHLCVTLTLSDEGESVVSECSGAVEEGRLMCYPEVVQALRTYAPYLEYKRRVKRLASPSCRSVRGSISGRVSAAFSSISSPLWRNGNANASSRE